MTLLLTLACVPGGCADGASEAGTFTVRDSAGIRIVENGASPAPELSIKGREIHRFGEYDFIQIRNGAIRSDDAVAVSDTRGDAVVVLDANGDFAFDITGPGEGPSEVTSPFGLIWLGGDTLLVQDIGNGRHSLFTQGEPAGSVRLPFVLGFGPLRGRLPDGRVVIEDGAYSPASPDPWVTEEVYVYDYDSEVTDTVLEYDIAQGRSDVQAPFPPFSPWGALAVTESRLASVRGDRPEVRIHDITGAMTEVWRWREPQPATTDSLWNDLVQRRTESWGSRPEDELRRQLAGQKSLMPSVLPYTSFVYGDDVGRIWVAEYDARNEPRRYRVFAPDGRRVADVRVPRRSLILDISGDRLLAAVMDDFDVPTVTLFDISEVPR